MHLLLISLNDFLISSDYSVSLIKEEIVLVKEGLEFLRSFFGNVEQESFKDLWTQVLDVAYEAEHSINSILVRSDDCLLYLISLPDIIEKIKLIRNKVFNLPEKISNNMGLNIVNSPDKPVVSNSSSIVGQVIVGFEEETQWIIRKLTSGPAELDVISIIGMPGAGKTSLASRVYNNTFVASHFDVRAWCTVDQERNEKKFLHNIFYQVIGSKETYSKDALDNDIADKLRKELFAKRYLIVLDDLWDTATLDKLMRPFPEFQKGSRVILTSRIKDVALHGKRNSDPLYLRLFRVEESWGLLQKKVFGEESCPDELLDVGKGIAQKCRGLPLVANLIAGVIERKEKKRASWLEVLTNLTALVLKNEVDVRKVIQLSYDHLSDNLKPCLLYLASYPKDEQIHVMDLKEFWAAEGFVEQTNVKSVEEVLDDYLDCLISCSLVMRVHRVGVTETCQIHDLVHDFCLVKAREEKLFGFVTTSESSLMPRRMIIDLGKHDCNSHNSCDLFNPENTSIGKHILSVKVDVQTWQINQLSHLRLLRVLCLGELIVVTESLLNEIGRLVHLRYLQVKLDDLEALPLSWSNLWNLETLVVDNHESDIALLPRIWNLAKLRRMSMVGDGFFDLDIDEQTLLLAKDSKLEYLRILEWIIISNQKDKEDILERFPHLQILKCRILQSPENVNWLPKFDILSELEELVVGFWGEFHGDFHFPSSLKILNLLGFSLTSDSLSTISRLPNLQKLKLSGWLKIQGGEWNVGENDAYMNLKYLELDGVDVSEWVAGEESFPVLEELSLRGCRELKETPSSFGDIDSLKSIKVEYCLQQLGDSALKIKEYVADMKGEDKLQVLTRGLHTNWYS